MIDLQIEHDRTAVGTGFWAPFKQVFGRWHLTKRLLIVTTLFIWQNGTGINAINYYSPTVFKSLGITGTNTSLFTTGIFGIIKTIGALVWAFIIVDRYGRRGVLLVGAVGGAISMYSKPRLNEIRLTKLLGAWLTATPPRLVSHRRIHQDRQPNCSPDHLPSSWRHHGNGFLLYLDNLEVVFLLLIQSPFSRAFATLPGVVHTVAGWSRCAGTQSRPTTLILPLRSPLILLPVLPNSLRF